MKGVGQPQLFVPPASLRLIQAIAATAYPKNDAFFGGPAPAKPDQKSGRLLVLQTPSLLRSVLLTASRETVQQLNGMVQYGGWTVLSGGVSVLLKWHENQYCADEELDDLACTPARLITGAMIVATVGCTFFLFGKISAYYRKKGEEDKFAKKKQELEENLRQAQTNLKYWKAEGPCAIM